MTRHEHAIAVYITEHYDRSNPMDAKNSKTNRCKRMTQVVCEALGFESLLTGLYPPSAAALAPTKDGGQQ